MEGRLNDGRLGFETFGSFSVSSKLGMPTVTGAEIDGIPDKPRFGSPGFATLGIFSDRSMLGICTDTETEILGMLGSESAGSPGFDIFGSLHDILDELGKDLGTRCASYTCNTDQNRIDTRHANSAEHYAGAIYLRCAGSDHRAIARRLQLHC